MYFIILLLVLLPFPFIMKLAGVNCDGAFD
jgi:hypothetical protein